MFNDSTDQPILVSEAADGSFVLRTAGGEATRHGSVAAVWSAIDELDAPLPETATRRRGSVPRRRTVRRQACSASSRLRIFPVGLRGRSSMKTTSRGTL